MVSEKTHTKRLPSGHPGNHRLDESYREKWYYSGSSPGMYASLYSEFRDSFFSWLCRSITTIYHFLTRHHKNGMKKWKTLIGFTLRKSRYSPESHIIWKKEISSKETWSEKRSTSPSQRSLSLCKILTQTKDDDDDIYYQEYFAGTFAKIINVSIDSRTSLPLWERVHSILLRTDYGRKIHRFRLLHLYEADLSLTLRHIITRNVRDNAEEIGLL